MFVFLSGVVYVVGQEGSKIYGAKCASCHGKDGKGNPSMAKMFKVDVSALNLVDKETLGKTDEELTATISKGKDKMPVFGGKLKGDELSSVVAYVRGLGSSAPAKGKVEGGAVDASKIYGAKCASCHGKDGKGNPSMAKMFKVDNAA
ncbi:MAG: c-type cytochrome, partial [Elusimicrobia bacterium]|nr:c-type cytochrome [Elusimicrobiota bacterium]